MTSPPLFVYGLLRRGMSAGLGGARAGGLAPRSAVGAEYATFFSEATLAGKLYDLGAYPGVVLAPATSDGRAPGDERVIGELWRLRDDAYWRVLDDFEGIGPGYAEPTLYRRVLAQAHRSDGEAVTCWVYVYNRGAAAAPVIASGDWARR